MAPFFSLLSLSLAYHFIFILMFPFSQHFSLFPLLSSLSLSSHFPLCPTFCPSIFSLSTFFLFLFHPLFVLFLLTGSTLLSILLSISPSFSSLSPLPPFSLSYFYLSLFSRILFFSFYPHSFSNSTPFFREYLFFIFVICTADFDYVFGVCFVCAHACLSLCDS